MLIPMVSGEWCGLVNVGSIRAVFSNHGHSCSRFVRSFYWFATAFFKEIKNNVLHIVEKLFNETWGGG